MARHESVLNKHECIFFLFSKALSKVHSFQHLNNAKPQPFCNVDQNVSQGHTANCQVEKGKSLVYQNRLGSKHHSFVEDSTQFLESTSII